MRPLTGSVPILEPDATAGPDVGRRRAVPDAPSGGRGRRLIRRHPAASLFAVALTARLAFALISFVVSDSVLIPDERQYIDLAASIADGDGPEGWHPTYGPKLFGDTWAYTGPVAAAFDVLGPSRLWAQLLAAVAGALAAVLTWYLVNRLASMRAAVGAGLLVGLLPSQVLWSSVALRESFVWTAMLATAVGVTWTEAAGRRALVGLTLVAGGTVVLGGLRFQTALIVTWSLVLLGITRWRRPWMAAALLVIGLLAPLTAGLGVGGASLITERADFLSATRTSLSFNANSSFVPTTIVGQVDPPERQPGQDLDDRFPQRDDEGGSTRREVTSPSGAVLVVEEGLVASLRAVPRGVSATMLRPLPWESTSSIGGTFARVENVLWFALYVFAILGVVRRWRTGSEVWYPVVLIAGFVALAAVTQGNVGTAFRHRGQIAWALVLLAALAVDSLPLTSPQRRTFRWRSSGTRRISPASPSEGNSRPAPSDPHARR